MRERLLATIRDSIIGADAALPCPWGLRRVTYADYTASGRSLSFIEDFIRSEVMPLYANTHTEASGTGRQTNRFREDARSIVANALGAGESHAVVFCGSGATAAINKLIDVLNLRVPADLDARYRFRELIPPIERPVVFIGPYEHHSNELPWRESIADVVTIDEDADGQLDLEQLTEQLRRYADRPLRIGSFSAASNVTGIVSQIEATTALLHRFGALSFWDFAAAAPHMRVEIDRIGMDAVFVSPHKLIGGPGTPGVLVARKRLFTNRVPTVPGGGTVQYVNGAGDHVYLADPVQREEGGTPAILESIRAGLAFQLREAVGTELIREREDELIRRAVRAWAKVPNLRILGNLHASRTSIVSFVVRHGPGFLHHDYVVALLNDLFGIQARGGCSCAGPYGHRLLGIDLTTSRGFAREVAAGCNGIKPGWVRVNFSAFMSEAQFEFLLAAVELIAEQGWRLLPLYEFEPSTGLWRHKRAPEHTVRRLGDVSYASGKLEFSSAHPREPETALRRYLDEAKAILASSAPGLCGPMPVLSEGAQRLRWFPLPNEIEAELLRSRR